MLCHCGKSLMLYCCITNSCVVVTAEKKIARIRGLFHWASRACLLRVLSTTSRVPLLLSSSSLLLLLLLPGGEQEESPLTRSPMVAIVTEAWALAGCGAASKATAELPVQQAPPAAAGKAKKAVSFRGVSSGGGGGHDRREAVVVGRRSGLASCLLAAVAASFSPLAGDRPARALVLEEDDDIELLERVKEDRKKRLQKQGVISSSGTETGYLQDLIYKLSKVGQAIDKDDLPAASSVLGPSSDAQWVQNINEAFSKFSSSPEERSVADSFNASLDSLFTSVSKLDAESSKSAFVSSATALEKWIALAGLSGQLKGF